MADIVVAEGYAEVGYEYINVDDCWLEKDRSVNGQLVPDRQRFPYGMKSLANYVSFNIPFNFLPQELQTYCYVFLLYRFIQKVLSLEFMRILVTTHVLGILEYWDT